MPECEPPSDFSLISVNSEDKALAVILKLAEKLFAALKAGDDAGGDSRGKQSASMIVVRKGGGRNINNDRYLYLNVDDNPLPIPELRP